MVHTKLLDALEGADTSGLSILKLSALYPLPQKLIADFLAKCSEVLVVEEVDPYIEDAIKAIGYDAGFYPANPGQTHGTSHQRGGTLPLAHTKRTR